MKKVIFALGVSLGLLHTYSFASDNCCYEPPVGKAEYATKDYVDSKIKEINSKLDGIESRVSKLKSEIDSIPVVPAGLAEKVSNLESELSELGKTCPSECNAKLVKVEKDLSELKEKVEKRSKHIEKEVEKSMRK